jgi:precorrin-2/cobalt-factor-2 C20-methyltransferase
MGVLYGIGVGPGDPGLMTIKAARILGGTRRVFAPRSRQERNSKALQIAGPYLNPEAIVHEMVFPMTRDRAQLEKSWLENARTVAEPLLAGEDACFITLGDSTLYSTFTYVVRTLRSIHPEAVISIVPGVTAFSAVAASSEFPVGWGKAPVTILPSTEDFGALEKALGNQGAVVIMKVGKRLPLIIDLLEKLNLLDNAVFASKVGLEGQRLVTDLRELRYDDKAQEYISTILVNCC